MKKARSSGFTIIEVMIVLTVTGLLFVAAAGLISGRTDQTEFDQSIRATQQQIQDTINEVQAGNFTDEANFSCTGNAGTINLTNSPNQQGTNVGCIFAGKVMQFGIGVNQDQNATYTIASSQLDASGQPATSLGASNPTIVAPSVGKPTVPQDSLLSTLEYGLHTYCNGACATNGNSSVSFSAGGPPISVGAIAFVYSFSQYYSSNSGSEQLNLIPVEGTSLGMPAASASNDTADQIDNSLTTSPVANSGDIASLCFQSATTNQYGLITIGSNNSQLSVTLSIMSTKNGTTCP